MGQPNSSNHGAAELGLEGELPGRPPSRPGRDRDDQERRETWPQRIFVADIAGSFLREETWSLTGRAPVRPKLQSMPPSPRARPERDGGRLFSSEGVQGTSWKPRPSSIMANRPEASAKRCR